MFVSRTKKMLILAAVVAFSMVALLTVRGVNAQDAGNGLRISPPRIVTSIFPGSSDTFSIDVTNVTADPLVAIVSVDNFTSDDEGGTPQLNIDEDFSPPYSIEPFIGELESLDLQPGEKSTLVVTATIPVDASPGGYYGLIRFTAVPEGVDDTSGVALAASVGTIVLIEVPGDIVEAMSLVELAAANGYPGDSSTGSLFESSPDSVVVRLQNDGNSFLQPFGRISVKDWSGNVVYEYELNDGDPRGNILPNTIRRFEDPIENVGSFGRFTIEANIGYGDGGGNIISSTSTFWIVPWKLILVGIAVVAAVAFGATKGIKMYNERIIEKSKKR